MVIKWKQQITDANWSGKKKVFVENGSEIETVARDCIGENVGYVLKWFGISIDVEEAI